MPQCQPHPSYYLLRIKTLLRYFSLTPAILSPNSRYSRTPTPHGPLPAGDPTANRQGPTGGQDKRIEPAASNEDLPPLQRQEVTANRPYPRCHIDGHDHPRRLLRLR